MAWRSQGSSNEDLIDQMRGKISNFYKLLDFNFPLSHFRVRNNKERISAQMYEGYRQKALLQSC